MAVHVTRAGVALTVGIILLTGLIVGGLLWAKESGEQARRAEALQVAEQNLEEQSRRDVALNEGDKAKEEAKEEAEKDNAPTTPGTGQASPPVQALPETGSSDGLAVLLAGILTYVGVVLYRSRAL